MITYRKTFATHAVKLDLLASHKMRTEAVQGIERMHFFKFWTWEEYFRLTIPVRGLNVTDSHLAVKRSGYVNAFTRN